MQQDEANKLIEENYSLVKEISERLCIQYNIPFDCKDEVLSDCQLAVVESTIHYKGHTVASLKTFWETVCENKVIDSHRKRVTRLKLVQAYTNWLGDHIAQPALALDTIIEKCDFSTIEAQVLDLFIRGLPNKEIMDRLGINRYKLRTVKNIIYGKIRSKATSNS